MKTQRQDVDWVKAWHDWQEYGEEPVQAPTVEAETDAPLMVLPVERSTVDGLEDWDGR